MWEKLWQLPSLMKTAYGRAEGQRLWEWNVQFQKEWEKAANFSHVLGGKS